MEAEAKEEICTCSYCPTHHEGFVQVCRDDLLAVLRYLDQNKGDVYLDNIRPQVDQLRRHFEQGAG